MNVPLIRFLFSSFRQLISGSGWLVRGGASYVKHSGDIDPHGSFATEKAPRTGLAVMANGTVLSVAVDGTYANVKAKGREHS